MTQEVQIILTMEVDAEKSKKDIEAFFHDMEQTYTRTASARNRWEFPKITLVQVKEEAEIYGTEEDGSDEKLECPNTKECNLIMFTADLDICQTHGKQFDGK